MIYRVIVEFEATDDVDSFVNLLKRTGPIPLLLTLPEIFDSVELQYEESEENNETQGQRRNNASSH